MTAIEKASETKECGLCKCTIYRGDRDSQKWGKMRYCSQRCSALHRGVLIGGWRNDKKECKVCGSMFGARPGITKGCWRAIKCCSDECSNISKSGYTVRRLKMQPAACITTGQRVKFLRLSKSPCGKKTPWSVRYLAKLAGCGDGTIEKVEADMVVLVPGVIDAICVALKIKPEWLTWSEKKWTRVISETKLTATELVKIKPNTNESNRTNQIHRCHTQRTIRNHEAQP